MKERLNYMDWAKAFGLYLIVLGHYIPNWTTSLIATYLYTFHVPLFFIVSGFFAKKEAEVKDLKKITKSLVIPYFLLVLMGYIFDILFCGINAHDIPRRGFLMLFGDPAGFVNPMWFVFTLIMVRCIWIIECEIYRKIRRGEGIICLLFLILLCFDSMLNFNLIPSFIGRIIIAYPLFFSGYLISKFKLIDKVKPYYFICLILLPVLAYKINGVIDVYSFRMGRSVMMFYFFSLLSSYGWICIFKSILNLNSQIINTIVTGSLIVVAFHKFFLRLIFDSCNDNLVCQLVIPILVMLILYYPIKFIQKYIPFLIGNRKV